MRYHQRHLAKYSLVGLVFILLSGFYLWQVFIYPKDVIRPEIVSPAPVTNPDNYIDDLAIKVQINQTGQVDVIEKFNYNFASSQKFFRVIKTGYQKFGAIYILPFKLNEATVSDQPQIIFSQTKDQGFVTLVSDSELRGVGQVTLKYNLGRVINSYPDFQELVWPILGKSFVWPINRTGLTLVLPEHLASGNISADCQLISPGIEKDNCLVTSVSQKQVGLAFFQVVNPGQDLLISISWPGQAVNKASGWLLLQDNYFIFFPLLCSLIMFLLWLFHGRDLLGQKPSHKPEIMDFLSPAEAGFLIDERIDRRDLATVFLSLAKNGYLKIIELENSWQLAKLKDFSDLRSWEKILVEQLFVKDSRVSTTEIKSWLNISQVWLESKAALNQDMIERGFFNQNPAIVRQVYTVFGFFICLLSPVVFLTNTGWLNSLAVFFSGFIVIAFGQIMPRKLAAGTAALQDLKAFERHLLGLTSDNKSQNKLQLVDPKTWESLLALALVLGFADDFSRHFVCQPLLAPAWYENMSPIISSQDLTTRIYKFYQEVIKLLP